MKVEQGKKQAKGKSRLEQLTVIDCKKSREEGFLTLNDCQRKAFADIAEWEKRSEKKDFVLGQPTCMCN